MSPRSESGRPSDLDIEEPSAQYCVAKPTQAQQEGSVFFEYLNQGGANVIFKIHRWSQEDEGKHPFIFLDAEPDKTHATPLSHSSLTNKVLRVDKGLSKTLRSQEVISGFYNSVRPLFVKDAPLAYVVNEDGGGYKLCTR